MEEGGCLGRRVFDYLDSHVRGSTFCEIELVDFFSLSGVPVEDGIARFPDASFSCGDRKDILLFKANAPQYQAHRYLQAILDVAQQYGVTRLYTISTLIAPMAHTSIRKILAVFNAPEFQEAHHDLDLENMDWQGPPALSSYLLWAATRRGIPGASLWTTVPFYLSSAGDPGAVKRVLEFLDRRLNLGIDLASADQQVAEQNARLTELRGLSPEVDNVMEKLEVGFPATQEECDRVATEVSQFLALG